MLSEFIANANWLAILVATLIYFVIGAVWYGVFAKPWMEAVGKTKEQLQGGSKLVYVYTFVYLLFICFILCGIICSMDIEGFGAGLELGLIISIAFSAGTCAVNNMFAQRPLNLFLVDSGYHITGITIASIILAIWK